VFKAKALDQVRNPPASLPKEAWAMVGGYDAAQPASELLQYMMRDMPDGTRQPSIIYNGFLGDDYQPLPLDEASCRWLRAGGVRFVASGHLPNGDAPLVMRYEDVTIVSADISYAESVSYEDAESDRLPSGEAVCEVLFSPTMEQESRVHGTLRTGLRHSARLGDAALGKVAAGNW
ncbi:SDR1, partial [Symbiodinium sp. CCMP2592]